MLTDSRANMAEVALNKGFHRPNDERDFMVNKPGSL
jgi:hypothetical protein